MTHLTRSAASFLALSLLLLASTAQASLVISPPGLNVGDTYQLAFVTNGYHTGQSTSIADYDLFVNAQADLGGIGPTSFGTSGFPITWKVIGSTATVDAESHALVSSPVYNLNGSALASGYADFWDGGLATSILYDQYASVTNVAIMTGSLTSGLGLPGRTLGAVFVQYGVSNLSSSDWISRSDTNNDNPTLALYALSAPITVTPEPSSLALAAFGLVSLAAWGWRRRKRSH